LLCCSLGLGCSVGPEVTAEEVAQVRNNLMWIDPQDKAAAHAKFEKLGTRRLYAAFEVILDDPREDQETVCLFSTLLSHEGDRSRFVKPAVSRLAHPNPSVRTVALMLLEKIGTQNEATAVVALLSDRDRTVAEEAARALVKLGGPNEVVAMDAWLQGDCRSDDPKFRRARAGVPAPASCASLQPNRTLTAHCRSQRPGGVT